MESDDESIVLEKRDKMNVDVLLKMWLYQTVTQTFVQRNVAIKMINFITFMKKRTSICSQKH